jgi:hypothetical protein
VRGSLAELSERIETQAPETAASAKIEANGQVNEAHKKNEPRFHQTC